MNEAEQRYGPPAYTTVVVKSRPEPATPKRTILNDPLSVAVKRYAELLEFEREYHLGGQYGPEGRVLNAFGISRPTNEALQVAWREVVTVAFESDPLDPPSSPRTLNGTYS